MSAPEDLVVISIRHPRFERPLMVQVLKATPNADNYELTLTDEQIAFLVDYTTATQ